MHTENGNINARDSSESSKRARIASSQKSEQKSSSHCSFSLALAQMRERRRCAIDELEFMIISFNAFCSSWARAHLYLIASVAFSACERYASLWGGNKMPTNGENQLHMWVCMSVDAMLHKSKLYRQWLPIDLEPHSNLPLRPTMNETKRKEPMAFS